MAPRIAMQADINAKAYSGMLKRKKELKEFFRVRSPGRYIASYTTLKGEKRPLGAYDTLREAVEVAKPMNNKLILTSRWK
jgi:hypothetical protein